jgi:type IV conjugative transfer system coupling protein TraD
LPISTVQTFPPVLRAWGHMVDIMETVLLRSALLLVPAFVAFYWFAVRFGRKSAERKHERGALLTTLPKLVEEIRVHNKAERARELSAMLGWRWRLCRSQELDRVLPYRPSRIAQITYPWRLEQSHAMLIGTTGMGKTVALSDMIEEARRRGQRAVIFDLTGTFIEHFYDASRDVILNPLDARCPQWSVFDECRDEAEFTAAAEAIVPHDGGGSEQFWVLAARLLFVEMCLKLRERGCSTNAALADELMTADLAAVHSLMQGTIADPLTAPEAARMAESIRAVFNSNAKALKLLPSRGPRFSVREWIESDKRDGGIVFISARYIDMSVCSQLLTVWLDLAMNTLMAMERTRDLRMWFFIDEMGALHRLPSLQKGLQTARNFGGGIVTGIHAFAKLKEVYGEDIAQTLSSLARTKLILGTADRDTATWCSDFIGHAQVRDREVGYTYGYDNARDAVSLTTRRHIEPLVLPDQLMNLPRLTGFLKYPDGFPAAPVKLVPVDRPKRAEPFIRRANDGPPPESDAISNPAGPRPAPTPSQDSGSETRSSSNDDGAGQRVVLGQGELDLIKPLPVSVGTEGTPEVIAQQQALHAQAGAIPIAGAKPASVGADGPPAARSLAHDMALRAGGGDELELPNPGKAPGGLGTGKQSAPRVQTSPLAGQVAAAANARKLLIEDGLPAHKPPPPEIRGLGEADIEI